MSIANIISRYSLLLLHPEALQALFAFLAGAVAWSKVEKLPSKYEIPLLCVIGLGIYVVHRLLKGPYAPWYESARQKANQNHLIGATQSEVDLEAQPLNFPPMPDTFDIEYNPWELP